jgi:hypothetical protein
VQHLHHSRLERDVRIGLAAVAIRHTASRGLHRDPRSLPTHGALPYRTHPELRADLLDGEVTMAESESLGPDRDAKVRNTGQARDEFLSDTLGQMRLPAVRAQVAEREDDDLVELPRRMRLLDPVGVRPERRPHARPLARQQPDRQASYDQ